LGSEEKSPGTNIENGSETTFCSIIKLGLRAVSF
jgi:hypothetical protein